MLKIVMSALLFAACSLSFFPSDAAGEEQKYELKSPAATVKDVLQENTGKRVTVRLENGEDLEGTVTKVGELVVHIAKLSGKDFYDAVVRIDRISAVIFKVRG
ncbi:MAG TPA: hypothetical protein VN604_04885 [Nitrospirota bacterium]|nr:hypothetical protein [Nitrospirota bacterium]